MEKEDKIVLFEGKKIRRIKNNGEWYFSVIDIIEVLTDSVTPRKYWSTLKTREPQLSSVCGQLKMVAADERERLTDAANTEGILRIIMNIPSPKPERVQLWLLQILEKHDINLYQALLIHIKQMIVDAQIVTITIRNRRFLKLYWNIGHCILALQKEAGHNNNIITQLSKNLKSAFPQVKGLTEHNLEYMRKFALENPKIEFVQESLAQIE